MRKTSVYLNDEEIARLAVLARHEGASQSEVLRRAIRQYRPERHHDPSFSLIGCAEGPGGSIADLNEEKLLQGFGE